MPLNLHHPPANDSLNTIARSNTIIPSRPLQGGALPYARTQLCGKPGSGEVSSSSGHISQKPSKQTTLLTLSQTFLLSTSTEMSPRGNRVSFDNLVDSYLAAVPTHPKLSKRKRTPSQNWATEQTRGGPAYILVPPSAFGGSSRSGTIKRPSHAGVRFATERVRR